MFCRACTPGRLVDQAVRGSRGAAKHGQVGVCEVVAVEAGPRRLPGIPESVLPYLPRAAAAAEALKHTHASPPARRAQAGVWLTLLRGAGGTS